MHYTEMFIMMQYLQPCEDITKQCVIQNITFCILPKNLSLASIFQAIVM